jgi:5'-deoxynucleotidase YfbR-like HD superfamily hydrolase
MKPEERELAYVPRWSILRVNKRQSVAEHCYFVTRYVIELAKLLNYPLKSDFIETVLCHDDGEIHSGDIPTPWKKKIGIREEVLEIEALTDFERKLLKIADVLEAILYLVDEQLSGNVTTDPAEESLSTRLEELTWNVLIPSMNNMGLFDYLDNVIQDHKNYTGRAE